MLGVEVSDKLLYKFKVKCLTNKTSMKHEITRFMKSYIGE